MPNKSPKLSVVIPCFNKEEYLIKMIECIMRQTLQDWELILVDDGSSNESFNKVHSFVKNDTRIQHIRRDRLPKNGNTCRNIGMDRVNGTYLIICDADDLLSDTCFENRVKFMEEHPDCDYASFPTAFFVDGTFNYVPHNFERSNTHIKERILSANYPFTVWANIYKSSRIRNIHWDENLHIYQDFDYMLRCELDGLKHCWYEGKEQDYFYRRFPNSLSASFISQLKHKSTMYLFEKTINSISEQPDTLDLKDAFLSFVVLQFERLIMFRNNDFIIEFLQFIKQNYKEKYCRFANIYHKNRMPPATHFQLSRFYMTLYLAFKKQKYKTMMIREFIKIPLGNLPRHSLFHSINKVNA